MTQLSSHQKQLLLDYCLGLTSQSETAEAETLVSSNPQAAQLASTFKSALHPLEAVQPQSCPDELAVKTIERVSSARTSELRLQDLLATEQSRAAGAERWFWPDWGKRLATAAAFMVVGSILITVFGTVHSYVRHSAIRQRCQMGMHEIWRGLDQYNADYGALPAVASVAGAPWWKIGDQSENGHSNTRALWLLVALQYVEPSSFVCPGSPRGKAVVLDTCHSPEYRDFPGREYVTYSFRIRCDKGQDSRLICRKILMADLNPLFEDLPRDHSKSLDLRLTKELLTRNSINHNRRGQNILCGDGRVEFVRRRRVGIAEDDIFTLQDRDVYHGTEVPSCATDAFLAP